MDQDVTKVLYLTFHFLSLLLLGIVAFLKAVKATEYSSSLNEFTDKAINRVCINNIIYSPHLDRARHINSLDYDSEAASGIFFPGENNS